MIRIHHIPQAFSDGECARLVALAAEAHPSDAGLVGGVRDHTLRRADLVWLDDLPESDWVMPRIVDLVLQANREVYRFDLEGFDENAQIARYGAEREGHFGWHSDIGDGRLAARRKLTMVVQLSDPEGYAGGALEIMPSANVDAAPSRGGTATLFPSFLLHRVTPVTDGSRHSLTIWAHGPGFR